MRGSDVSAAFVVHVVAEDGSVAQIAVEYARGGPRRDSVGHARQAVIAYLDDPTPPERLVVDREGKVSAREV
jgi:hypothetical protein